MKKVKRTVRGPQQKLALAQLKSARGGRRKLPEKGNPLVAFRAPAELWSAYVAHHAGVSEAYDALRGHMRHVLRIAASRGGAA